MIVREKVFKIFDEKQERVQYNWKLIVGDKGNWGYTSSQIDIGDIVEFFEVDNDFKFYVRSINGALTKKYKTANV